MNLGRENDADALFLSQCQAKPDMYYNEKNLNFDKILKSHSSHAINVYIFEDSFVPINFKTKE